MPSQEPSAAMRGISFSVWELKSSAASAYFTIRPSEPATSSLSGSGLARLGIKPQRIITGTCLLVTIPECSEA